MQDRSFGSIKSRTESIFSGLDTKIGLSGLTSYLMEDLPLLKDATQIFIVSYQGQTSTSALNMSS